MIPPQLYQPCSGPSSRPALQGPNPSEVQEIAELEAAEKLAWQAVKLAQERIIYWRKTSSSWLRQVAVVISTSTRDVERIAEAAIADFNG